MKWCPDEVVVSVPLPGATVSWGRWQVLLFLRHWFRERGAYPSGWRNLPPVKGEVAPLYVWWHLGPIEVRRFRWVVGRVV